AERLPVQGPIEQEAVARRPSRHGLRKARRQEVLLAGAGVRDAARRGHARQPRARPRVPHRPRGRGAVVNGLPVEGIVLPGESDRVGEGEIRWDGLLADGEYRADDEPDGQQQVIHAFPWTGRWDASPTRLGRGWFRDATNLTPVSVRNEGAM